MPHLIAILAIAAAVYVVLSLGGILLSCIKAAKRADEMEREAFHKWEKRKFL
jgi:hypothetical protein